MMKKNAPTKSCMRLESKSYPSDRAAQRLAYRQNGWLGLRVFLEAWQHEALARVTTTRAAVTQRARLFPSAYTATSVCGACGSMRFGEGAVC
mmetsp:Transcript_140546/g.350368  ORF Transcript_140546/g.350368 Transcript_140546/m.350368 type:complete len:92 (+) Transcript_140546:649-924(+)